MPESIIVLEIVNDRNSATETAQQCSALTSSYYEKSADANVSYPFSWAPGDSELIESIKVGVGGIDFILKYDDTNQIVLLTGICNSAYEPYFNISDKTLVYDDGNTQFNADFVLINGTEIEISVVAMADTTINAYE
ncbi:MAG: hypothetical protein H6569_02615 [Lewinellaceae bacterium]|nr:hypothetical protein [Saprospiraceae bacterium]MCB9315009.1 hypothetical protein [Lewinellaceae bacterium]